MRARSNSFKEGLASGRRPSDVQISLIRSASSNAVPISEQYRPTVDNVMWRELACDRHRTDQGCGDPDVSTPASSLVRSASRSEDLVQRWRWGSESLLVFADGHDDFSHFHRKQVGLMSVRPIASTAVTKLSRHNDVCVRLESTQREEKSCVRAAGECPSSPRAPEHTGVRSGTPRMMA